MTTQETPPTPPAGRTAAHWLGVACGGHRFLVPLAQSGEIAAPSAVQPLPHAKAWVRGVTTLRGELYTVVDLLAWLGWPALADDTPGQARFVSGSGLLGVNVLWPVDQLLGLRSADSFRPAPEPVPSPVVRQVLADAQDNVWYDLDLLALCERADFLDIHQRPASTGSP
ncbi:chemotaxis protein CheW [Hydrogenophaga atypica]|uniref:Chemotaxis protein CheW n=1 Tax=Hydrogenophaga atypica TaxID=249409 RepID=A0ABW2QPS6_9BURK